MKKITRLMLHMMFCASIMFAGCNKGDNNDPTPPSNGGDNGGGDNGEGIYLGIIGFNDQLYVKDISKLDQSTVYDFTGGFIDYLTPGNGTGLYYADYIALQKMHSFAKPPKLKNVALVTFTDGLDNVSLANDALNPENYNSTAEYREALHNKIINEQVHGFNISAYTIGLKGNDVTDNVMFLETLKKLASNDDNVFQVANMDEAMRRFRQIAENLYSVSTSVNLGVSVPGGYDDEQMLRFTFDNASSATSSSKYIEATYRRSNGRTLENISYHGFAQGAKSISSSSSQGTYYQFLFEDLKYANGTAVSQADINSIMLWKKTSTGAWDRESEFDPASSSNITEDRSSALIMLVLDCTKSLGDDFSRMLQSANDFVYTLANSNGGDNSGGGYSATVLFEENFDNGITSLWTIFDNDGDGNTWYSDNGYVTSDSYNDVAGTINADNWLISNTPITIPTSGEYSLQYDIKSYRSDYPDSYSIYVRLWDGNQITYTYLLVSETAYNNSWTTKTIDLSSYRGQSIFIAIRHKCYDAWKLSIDNVKIIGQ